MCPLLPYYPEQKEHKANNLDNERACISRMDCEKVDIGMVQACSSHYCSTLGLVGPRRAPTDINERVSPLAQRLCASDDQTGGVVAW